MLKRDEQKEFRRKEIIYKAAELFVQKGYKATKIIDIAEAANMSVGLLFHYFPSKEKLYESLVKIGLEGTKQPLQRKYDHALDYFIIFTDQLFKVMKDNPFTAIMFSLMEEAKESNGTPAAIKEIANQISTVEEFVPIIKQGQKEGAIKAGDPLVLSNAFWCAVQGIASNYARHKEIDLPDSSWIVDIIKK